MDRASVDWTGPMPALTTPFKANGQVDTEGYVANIERQIGAGATGVIAVGCTGEFWSLTHDERREIASVTVDAVDGRGTAIIGTGAITSGEVIRQAEYAAGAGADGILVMPPYFLHATPDELVEHFRAVSEASPLPVVLYNIPGNAGNAITPEIADRLADLEKVVAIKESSGDWGNFHRTLLTVRDRLRVFCGPSSVFGVAAVEAGADGLIDCFPNVWTKGCFDLWYVTKAGNVDKAMALQKTGIALTDLFVTGGRTLYPSTKAAMNYLGLPGGGFPRAPLLPLAGRALSELHAGLDRLLGDTVQSAVPVNAAE